MSIKSKESPLPQPIQKQVVGAGKLLDACSFQLVISFIINIQFTFYSYNFLLFTTNQHSSA